MSIPALASPFDALSLVVRIGSIGVVISSLESLWRRADLGRGGLLDAEIQITRARWLLRFNFLSSARAGVAITAVRLLAACALLAGGGNLAVARVGCIIVAVATLFLRLRTPFGIHASGTMVMITFTSAALGLAVASRRALLFALAFIAAQACLSYFVAGASKLREPTWRDGRALALIFSTLMWGHGREAVLLGSHRRLCLMLSWMTMVGECVQPLSLVVPLPVTLGLLGFAATFHLVTAIEMGLNSFVWAFGSYPAIIYCWFWLHGKRP